MEAIPLQQRMATAMRKTLFKTYRAALKGDEEAIHALFWWAKSTLRRNEIPAKGMNRFFLKVIDDPKLYAIANKSKYGKRRRGRPSIDDTKKPLFPPGFKFKKFKQTSESEKNAQTIAYLLSIGYLINEAGKGKESAVSYLSDLSGRSCRSLQTDYYKHKDKVTNNPNAIEFGRVWLLRLERLHELKMNRSLQ